ncbi:hypothetical protein [Anatilimnocola floriformis]|uniref:hypothetical protein n=1 Tax=Anatilimnocola floriformis TaxID=2948575 RepID=UPI0020C1CF2E|nr:hypothetical protein [Anatilimnocola floriformis]
MVRNWIGLLSLVAFALLTVGCGSEPAKAPAKVEEHAHEHASEGPHKGHLIELGVNEEYHGELTHDDASKTVTVYLLGKDAKTPVMSADKEIDLNLVIDGTPTQAKLTAAPQDGEKEGESSRFTLVDEKILEALENPKTTGNLNVNIAGQRYSGKVALGAHGHDH